MSGVSSSLLGSSRRLIESALESLLSMELVFGSQQSALLLKILLRFKRQAFGTVPVEIVSTAVELGIHRALEYIYPGFLSEATTMKPPIRIDVFDKVFSSESANTQRRPAPLRDMTGRLPRSAAGRLNSKPAFPESGLRAGRSDVRRPCLWTGPRVLQL